MHRWAAFDWSIYRERMNMEWRIKHIFNFTEDKPWSHGFCHFGFHDKKGTQYMLNYDEHGSGCLTADDEFVWTAGKIDMGLSGKTRTL